ncbi:MAG: winged helix-turn-helix domain-containing protein [Acidobacteria bacterium]|nr:winged helix-turn-helix domain-containing protein [Acidobacteriota bacterium]
MMSYREAALEILRKERHPMTAKEIITAAVAAGLLTVGGRTPDASLAGRLYTDIQRNGKKSMFIQVGPRKYALREWSDESTKVEQQNSKLKNILMKVSINSLCEKFYNSIMALAEDLRAAFIHELLAGMRAAGANVTNHLLLLGVHSGRAESASASDIALLLRYYRINQPAIFDAAINIMEKFPEVAMSLDEPDARSLSSSSLRTRGRTSGTSKK